MLYKRLNQLLTYRNGVFMHTYPASMTGWFILNNFVRGVEKMRSDEGMGVVGQGEVTCGVAFIHLAWVLSAGSWCWWGLRVMQR